MINESTQDPNKPLRRPSPFDKDSSLNFLAGPLIYETKDFEDINNNLPNFKTKGFANSNFGNYNSNLGFLNGYGHSMFGQLEKPDISPNLYLSDLNSNKKDISFSKKPIEYDFSNQFNYQHSRNLGPSNMMNPLLENNHFFQNSNNNPILFEESHFCDNEKNLKNLFSQNANKMNLNFEQNISVKGYNIKINYNIN